MAFRSILFYLYAEPHLLPNANKPIDDEANLEAHGLRSRPVKWCKRERHPVEHIYADVFSRSASGRASSML